jgi:hypothetical protein
MRAKQLARLSSGAQEATPAKEERRRADDSGYLCHSLHLRQTKNTPRVSRAQMRICTGKIIPADYLIHLVSMASPRFNLGSIGYH